MSAAARATCGSAIAIQSPAPSDPQVLRQSSRQVARAIRSALSERAMNLWFTRPGREDRPDARQALRSAALDGRFPARDGREHRHDAGRAWAVAFNASFCARAIWSG